MEKKDFRIGDEVRVIESPDKTRLGMHGIVVNAGYTQCAVRYKLYNGQVECVWENYGSLDLVKHDAENVYAKEYLAAEQDRKNIPGEALAEQDTKVDNHPCMRDEERFGAVLTQMFDTFKAKNHDYGNSFAKTFGEFGLTAPVVRMNDKMERIKTLVKSDAQVKGESIRDTILDLANYAVLTLVELGKKA
jgi:hypothetical protein